MSITEKINRKRFRFAAIPLIILPFVWIVWRLDVHRMAGYARAMAWWTIPVLCAFILLSMTLQGVRWWYMLRSLLPDLTFRRAMSYHFIGIFYAIVLPTSASTDIVKTLLLSRKFDYSVAWGATWICRIMGLLALALLSIYGLIAIDRRFLPPSFWYALCTAFAVTVAVFALSFSKRFTTPLRPIVQRIVPKKLVVILENIRQGIYAYRNKRGALAGVFLITMLTQATMIMAGCFALFGMMGKLYISDYFAFIPIIEVVANSGPTPNGLGLREALTAIFFSYLHLSKEQLAIYVFMTLFFSVGMKLLGGIPVLHGMLKSRREKQPQTN